MKILKCCYVLTVVCLILISANCASNNGNAGKRTIRLYGFSIMRESLEKDIYPAFAAKWKREQGEDVEFVSFFGGSEAITRQILEGEPADVAILSIEGDVQRMIKAGHAPQDWWVTPQKGIVNKTPFVILVRKGNPLGIKDFPDLAKQGVKVIFPDPTSSGGAQWAILSIYGSELLKSEAETGTRDESRALQTLRAIWKNAVSVPGSAREARTQFEAGHADAIITYEVDGLQMQEAGSPVDIIVPQATVISEHPAVIVDRNVTADERPVVEAFRNFLWSEEAQRVFVKNHFRSATNPELDKANVRFAQIQKPFYVAMFGGWQQAHTQIVEDIFQKQVRNK